MANKLKSEYTLVYGDQDDAIVAKALRILERRLKKPWLSVDSPKTIKEFASLKLAELEREVFAVFWLNAQNQLMEYQELFVGSLTQAIVYPREVVKAGLKVNAAAAIFAHNHPSGTCEPSRADELLTTDLKRALGIVEIKVLDHIVVGDINTTSFAEKGLL
jgi:DNA repair protein RadC